MITAESTKNTKAGRGTVEEHRHQGKMIAEANRIAGICAEVFGVRLSEIFAPGRGSMRASDARALVCLLASQDRGSGKIVAEHFGLSYKGMRDSAARAKRFLECDRTFKAKAEEVKTRLTTESTESTKRGESRDGSATGSAGASPQRYESKPRGTVDAEEQKYFMRMMV